MHGRLHAARAAGLLLLGAFLQPPAAVADPPAAAPAADASVPALTEQQLKVAYATAVAIGSMSYTYYAGSTADEATAKAICDRLGPMPTEGRLASAGLKKVSSYAFQMAPALRDAVRNSAPGHLSKPFETNGRWGVTVKLAQSFQPMPTMEQLKDKLPRLVQAGALPSPDAALLPPLVYGFAASQVTSVDTLAKLSPDADVNLVRPDGLTMLMAAVATGQNDLIAALLARNADINKCASASCPLGLAEYSKDPKAMIAFLLDHGASPDMMDPKVGVIGTPLAEAMNDPKAVELGELLLAKGANVDGVPGDFPPVVVAAEKGNRPAVELLLKHGADLFRPALLQLRRNALTAAQLMKTDAAFQAWLKQTWLDYAKHSGRFAWQGWIDQGGKRTPIGDKPIVLERKPFDIVVRMRPDARLMVAASTERKLFEDLKSEGEAGPLHSIAAVVADVCDGGTRPLFLSGKSTTGKPDGNRVMAWSDAPECRGFTATASEGGDRRFTRTIGELATYDGTKGLAESDAKSLYLVVGTGFDSVFPSFEYFEPKLVELRFR